MDQIFGEPGVIQPTQKHRHSLQRHIASHHFILRSGCRNSFHFHFRNLGPHFRSGCNTERFCPDQTGSFSVRKGNLVDLPMMDHFVQEEEYCEHIYNMIRYRCTPTHTHTHHLKVKQFCFVFSIKACNIYPTDYVFGIHVFLFPFLEGLPQGAIHALSSKAPLPGGKIGSIGIFSWRKNQVIGKKKQSPWVFFDFVGIFVVMVLQAICEYSDVKWNTWRQLFGNEK